MENAILAAPAANIMQTGVPARTTKSLGLGRGGRSPCSLCRQLRSHSREGKCHFLMFTFILKHVVWPKKKREHVHLLLVFMDVGTRQLVANISREIK